jgi:hypothetical protein
MKASLPDKKSAANIEERKKWITKNPFEEFQKFRLEKNDLPLDQIVESTEEVMTKIRWGYEKLLEEEAKELVWMVQ